jgi:hypothetical protein
LIDETRDVTEEVAKEILPKPSQHETLAANREILRIRQTQKMKKLLDAVW